jgi:hypothetical protein
MIDVFVPAHPKDLEILPECVAAVRRYLRPRVNRVVVVSGPLDADAMRMLNRCNAEHLDESSLPGLFPRSEMREFCWQGLDRTGWYFQQLAKWAVRKCSTTPDYFVVDADTVLTRKMRVVSQGRYVLGRAEQYNEPYFRTIEKLLGFYPPRQRSFIVDYMILSVSCVDDLIGKIEQRVPGKKWHEIIVDAIDPNVKSSFSEFETYGRYMSKFHADRILSVDVRKWTLARKKSIGRLFDRARACWRRVDSISYHDYIGKER